MNHCRLSNVLFFLKGSWTPRVFTFFWGGEVPQEYVKFVTCERLLSGYSRFTACACRGSCVALRQKQCTLPWNSAASA